MAPIGRVLRALAVLPMSDRVSRACVGWAFSAPCCAFPLLAAGVAVCAAAQGFAFILSLALLAVATLILGISNFGFYSDKKVALRFARFFNRLGCRLHSLTCSPRRIPESTLRTYRLSQTPCVARYFEDIPQIVLSALFMYFKGSADTNAIINASNRCVSSYRLEAVTLLVVVCVCITQPEV